MSFSLTTITFSLLIYFTLMVLQVKYHFWIITLGDIFFWLLFQSLYNVEEYVDHRL